MSYAASVKQNKILAIKVFLERYKTRQYVGKLTRDDNEFTFEYDKHYMSARNVISLGPEMPLTKQQYHSKQLFVPFVDRIPSRENPAYEEYCEATGISSEENDVFVLLATIAKRGPSSFIFEAEYDDKFSANDLKRYREQLSMSAREFAECFETTQATITRIEKGQASGSETLKRIAIYAKHPEIALEQLQRRGGCLHTNKRITIEKHLRSQLQKN